MAREPASAVPASTDERIGGRYRIGEMIGHGGMADVFAAFDELLQRPVAVKRLRAEHVGDADLRRRFSREARAAGRITHPNVVAIYDVGEQNGVPFIVMERLSGRTLHDELRAGPVPMPRLRTHAIEVLGGLGAAHRDGILHRDMKPANVLLDETGHAKVGDFGIALVSDDAHHTSTGLVLGTLAYLPPERLAGGPATVGGDLYSTGVVLFEAATGRAAFRADSPLALTRAIASGAPAFRAAERHRLEPGFVAAIERAMAKEPADRFESAAAMVQAFVDDRTSLRDAPPTLPVRASVPPTERLAPTGAPPGDARVPTRPHGHRRRFLVAVTIVLISIAAATLVLTNRSGTGDPDTAGTPTTTAGVPPGSTPPPLVRALDRLDRSIGR